MIDNITLWHKRARPQPTERDLDVQIGCHIEEFIEMMDSLNIDANSDLARALDDLEDFADSLKAGDKTVSSIDREPLLDSLADQIVTAVGVGVPAVECGFICQKHFEIYDARTSEPEAKLKEKNT
jgi:hypothetical protein